MASSRQSSRQESPGSEVTPTRNEATQPSSDLQLAEPEPRSRSLRRSKRRKSTPGEWWANPPSSQRRRVLQDRHSIEPVTSAERQTGSREEMVTRDSPIPFASPSPHASPKPPNLPICQPPEISEVTEVRGPGAVPADDEMHATPSFRRKNAVQEPRVPSAPRKAAPARSRLHGIPDHDEPSRDDAEASNLPLAPPESLPAPERQSSASMFQEGRRVSISLTRGSELQFTAIVGKNGPVQVATAIAVSSSFIGELHVPGHTSTGPRRAADGDEVYFLQSGLLECDVDWVRVTLRQGDYVAIPHMSCYQFRNSFTFTGRLIFFASRNPSASTT